MSGGCICGEKKRIKGYDKLIPGFGELFPETYHHACTCISNEVKLAVYLADVISRRLRGPEEGDDVVIVILKLSNVGRGRIDGQGGVSEDWRNLFGIGVTDQDIIIGILTWLPSVLITIRTVEHS